MPRIEPRIVNALEQTFGGQFSEFEDHMMLATQLFDPDEDRNMGGKMTTGLQKKVNTFQASTLKGQHVSGLLKSSIVNRTR